MSRPAGRRAIRRRVISTATVAPTKTEVLDGPDQPGGSGSFGNCALASGQSEELYDLKQDPDCLKNLADDRRNDQKLKQELSEQMVAELKAQEDPRMFGRGKVFEQYPYAEAASARILRALHGRRKTASRLG